MTADNDLSEPVEVRLMTGAFAQITRSGDPVMRDLAREVLTGRITVTEIGRDPAVAERLLQATRAARQWRQNQPAEALAAQIDAVRRRITALDAALTERDRT